MSVRVNNMLHARLSTRPTSFRKSNITAISDHAPQLDDDNSNYTANLRDCVLALGDCGKQVSQPHFFTCIPERTAFLTNRPRRHEPNRSSMTDAPTFLGYSAWSSMKR